MIRIDSHQHFWNYTPEEYGWIDPQSVLARDYLPGDLKPELTALQLDGCVAVQARQSMTESRWLLELSKKNSFIRGVVGWVDLQGESVEAALTELKHSKAFVGVRHVVQDESDPGFMQRPAFTRGIQKVIDQDLAYDILIRQDQLSSATKLVRQFPDARFILDHIAKPKIKAREVSPWREEIQKLAALPNVACKVSGMITEADHTNWRLQDFRGYLDVVWEAFGSDRLMYGSDWPVALLAGAYADVYRVADSFYHALSETEQEAFYGTNAGRWYKLP